ncbi:MAG: helix-turn-helix transcriptional regulator [Prevotellaceae bacterium]|jgi:transcriptional regulator with XRE-family HTH domain|nr:helix-turn-helix transcriptional regulator [Prevotellaceae bacterium]
METIEKEEKNTHHGHAIKRFRHNLGIKQEALAADMGISQALVSFYEQKREIEEDMLGKFAKALGVSPQLIADLKEDPVTVIVENNNVYENNKDTAIATIGYVAGNTGDNIINNNPLEKITEIFEKLLENEQEKVALLEKLLKEKK